MNHKIIGLLFYAAGMFCLLALFNYVWFGLYETNTARGLQPPIMMLKTTNDMDLNSDQTQNFLGVLENYQKKYSFKVLFIPENGSGEQIFIYIAGNPSSFSSSSVRSGRFFSSDELLGKTNAILAYSDSWLDVFFFREKKLLSTASGEREIIGVLDHDDVLQRDGYHAVALFGTNTTYSGTWYLSSEDTDVTESLITALHGITTIVEETPIKVTDWKFEFIKPLLYDKFFVIFLFGYIVSLLSIVFYNIQYLQNNKEINKIRYLVGATKKLHYKYAAFQCIRLSIEGSLIGSALQFFFWYIIHKSSKAMMEVVFWYPLMMGIMVLVEFILFSMIYIKTDFIDKRKETK
ncbi:MAG: hypothetical protein VB070_06310 [Clostridiaceae bacterium]|nr:hypothetical protein [Clostridiaceae bacterium]